MVNKARLVAIVGAAAAAVLMQLTPKFEGTVYKTYKDLGGVLTYCTGATDDAVWGKTYTPQECADKLDEDLAVHAEGIAKCIPMDKLTVGQKVAFVDTAYNIGVAGFCGSSMRRYTLAGDMRKACDSLLMWDKVNGKQVRGLYNRRVIVREWCLKGVA